MRGELTKPVWKKSSSFVSRNGITVGSAEMQGWRANMEDFHHVSELTKMSDSLFLGVYDGHGGSHSAKHVCLNMIECFYSVLDNKGQDFSSSTLQESLVESFLLMDEHLRKKFSSHEQSGTTALVLLITNSDIIVANVGDCRGIFRNDGKTIVLTTDHKPNLESERPRIENAGGGVFNNRVDGVIALSRALGDFPFKNRPDLSPYHQKIIAVPEILKRQRENERDEFILLACDGIWDVMSNEQVCEFVQDCLRSGEKDPRIICEDLLDHCLTLGSKDNLSAICCLLPGAKIGTGKGIAERRKLRESQLKEKFERLDEDDDDEEAEPF